MSKSRRLGPLLDLAGIRESDAAHRLSASLEALEAKQRELEKLRSYLEEYRRLAFDAERAVESARWQNIQLFVGRLGEAVRVLETELDAAARSHDEEVERWRETHRHGKALAKLADKYGRAELEELERLEQAELDELVLRRRRLPRRFPIR